jgi:hypothetical protein
MLRALKSPLRVTPSHTFIANGTTRNAAQLRAGNEGTQYMGKAWPENSPGATWGCVACGYRTCCGGMEVRNEREASRTRRCGVVDELCTAEAQTER